MTGAEPLCLEIAGLAFGIHLPEAAWRAPIAARYAAFLAPAAPGWTVTVDCEPALLDPEAPWIRHEDALTTFQVAGVQGRVNLAAAQAAISVPGERQAASALDRALAYICMEALPRKGDALLLHAAGIEWAGAGYVFFGASGAGKTTVARLAAGRAEVLVDENVVAGVRPGGAGAELFSTPFWGGSTPPELIRRVNRRVPLRALLALTHAPAFTLTRLSAGEAVVALLGTEKIAVGSGESAAAWLAAAERLVEAAPVYRLGFRPTTELWDFLGRARW